MLTEKHIRDFSTACAELYKPGLGVGNYAERSFRFLEHLVPAEFIAFGSLDTKTQTLDIGFNEEVSDFPKAMEAFGTLMSKYSLFGWDPTVNEGRPFQRSDFFPGENSANSIFIPKSTRLWASMIIARFTSPVRPMKSRSSVSNA